MELPQISHTHKTVIFKHAIKSVIILLERDKPTDFNL